MTNTEKKIKKKGPIRTGAVLPFILFVAVVVAFNMFLLDSTLKKTFEFVGTKANGAEVNVGSVETSFKELRIEINKVQFTNINNPAINTFEIGKIKFEMLWDALLRAKFVISDIQVNDILIYTKRAQPGFVVPPPSAEEQAEKDKVAKEILAKAQSEFKGNIFGDIAGVLSGKQSTGKGSVKGDLKSKQKLNELTAEIKTREAKLSATFDKLPSGKEVANLQTRFNKINWKGLSSLQKAPKILKQIDRLKKDADRTLKAYNNANKEVNNHIKFVTSSTNKIQQFVNEDIKNLEKRMNIPSIDTKSIAQMIFGPEILSKIGMAQEYQAKVQKYLPPKKDKSKKDVLVKKIRKKGINYKFGTPNSYPMFWIKRVDVNSENAQGTVAGKITDITSDQNHINKSTKLNINGDFPGLEIRGVKVVGDFDHRAGAHDNINVKVASYPVKDKALSNSDTVKFIIRKAKGSSTFNAKFDDDKVAFTLDNYFKQIQYDNSAKSKVMDSLLKGVAKSTATITLKAKAHGKWKNLKWDIKSNLAKAIQDTAKRQIQEKIDAVKKKIRDDINKQIDGQKAEINNKLAKFKGQYEGQINNAKKQLDGFNKKINNKKKKSKNSAKKSLEKKGKDLLKKYKIKF